MTQTTDGSPFYCQRDKSEDSLVTVVEHQIEQYNPRVNINPPRVSEFRQNLSSRKKKKELLRNLFDVGLVIQ